MSVSISSASTLAQVKAAYYDNCTYDVDNSVAEANTFIAACRQLLVRLNKVVATGGRAEQIEIDPGVLERQVAECKRWLYVNNNRSSGSQTRVFSRGEPFIAPYPGPYWG